MYYTNSKLTLATDCKYYSMLVNLPKYQHQTLAPNREMFFLFQFRFEPNCNIKKEKNVKLNN